MTIKVGGMDVSGLKFGDIKPTTTFTVNGSKYKVIVVSVDECPNGPCFRNIAEIDLEAVLMDSDDPEVGRLDECIAYYATDDEYIADIIHEIL